MMILNQLIQQQAKNGEQLCTAYDQMWMIHYSDINGQIK